MTLTEDLTEQALISHCTSEFIHIKDKSYTTSIFITPKGDIVPWEIKTLEQLDIEYCYKILRYHPEIVLIGTGMEHQLPNLDIIRFFANHKIGVEMMNTSAACRTYNVLILENRQVFAGLLL
jgi:uncharacterized protein